MANLTSSIEITFSEETKALLNEVIEAAKEVKEVELKIANLKAEIIAELTRNQTYRNSG